MLFGATFFIFVRFRFTFSFYSMLIDGLNCPFLSWCLSATCAFFISFFLPICISIFISTFIIPLINLSIRRSTNPSICQSTIPFDRLTSQPSNDIYLPTYIYLYTRQSDSFTASLSTYLHLYVDPSQLVSLSVCLSAQRWRDKYLNIAPKKTHCLYFH